MEAKDFIFQNADGSWNFGRSKTSPCPAGGYRLDHVEGNETFTIRDRNNRDCDVGGLDRSPEEFMDATGTPYANFAAFYDACKGFFFRLGNVYQLDTYSYFVAASGLKTRIGSRAGYSFVIDRELTPDGFKGIEGINWENIGGNAE